MLVIECRFFSSLSRNQGTSVCPDPWTGGVLILRCQAVRRSGGAHHRQDGWWAPRWRPWACLSGQGRFGLLAEVGQALGAEEFLELGVGEEAVLEDEFGHALACGEGFLGDGGGGSVAQVGIEGCDQAD